MEPESEISEFETEAADAESADDAIVKAEPPKLKPGHVWVTVTKFGEGKISTGEHVAGQGDVMAMKGDVLECPADQAKIQEGFGLVEINA